METSYIAPKPKVSPHIRVLFHNIQKPYYALVDTGACASIINNDCYENLLREGLKVKTLTNKNSWPILRGVGGFPLQINNEILVNIELGKIKIEQRFFVIDKIRTDILLGIDFLSNNKLMLDFSNNVLIKNNYMLPLLFRGSKTRLALLSQDSQIRPNSLNKLEINCKLTNDVLFEPIMEKNIFQRNDVVLPVGLFSVNQGKVLPEIFNDTNKELKIKKVRL